jgi:prevent-host-death family protein
MLDVPLADAKAQLEELIERAERGELVQFTRDGKPIARLVGVEVTTARKSIDLAALRALTDMMPMQDESTETFMRKMRDDARY